MIPTHPRIGLHISYSYLSQYILKGKSVGISLRSCQHTTYDYINSHINKINHITLHELMQLFTNSLNLFYMSCKVTGAFRYSSNPILAVTEDRYRRLTGKLIAYVALIADYRSIVGYC